MQFIMNCCVYIAAYKNLNVSVWGERKKTNHIQLSKDKLKDKLKAFLTAVIS